MDDKAENADTKAVQLDRESQEYGSQHGQDTMGQETGSSAPTVSADDQSGIDDASARVSETFAGENK